MLSWSSAALRRRSGGRSAMAWSMCSAASPATLESLVRVAAESRSFAQCRCGQRSTAKTTVAQQVRRSVDGELGFD
ncbi:hypothetical protein [Nocardia noduli]|uniref:hypothetical protein n=1 Tax=Nocardia noduli TaxID=2815722 RepID=UPI001C2106B9|nr:hypothetical protein [Nocardia noduli]